MTDEHHSDECEVEASSPQEMPKETVGKAIRDPITGKFLKGTAAGPGRPKGSKDKLNVQVIDTLERLWDSRGAEILDQLAAEKPEVVMAMVSRLIPQQLAAEAITGEAEKAEQNQEVRITLVNQVRDDALPHHDVPRLVEGEVIDDDGLMH